jgi:hypothetical protein
LGGGRRGKSLIIYGAIFFIIGLVITIGTYATADNGGGTYIISWGPMVGGLVAMIRGAYDLTVDRRAMAGQPPLAPGAGYGAPMPGQPGYVTPGYSGPGFPAPAYAVPGNAMSPGNAVPGNSAPGYAGAGYAAPGQGFAAPAAAAPGYGSSPGFTPAPGFTPQAAAGTPGPGWFADPQNPTTLRWWDGQAWSAHTQPTAYTHPAGPAGPAHPGRPAGPAN